MSQAYRESYPTTSRPVRTPSTISLRAGAEAHGRLGDCKADCSSIEMTLGKYSRDLSLLAATEIHLRQCQIRHRSLQR